VLATVTYPNVGLVGVTNGEHFQLDVANVSRSSTPCLATLRVVGITGRVFMSSDVSLGAGRGAVLDFTPAVGASPRTEVRAVVVSKGDSCKAFQGSVEVVDDSNDRTVLWGGFTDPAG
jgi:hypothetical protein